MYYLLKVTGTPLPEVITSYLSDLLSLFIVNTVALSLIRKIKGNDHIELSVPVITFGFITFTVFFEYVMPRTDPYYIHDTMDVLCYGMSSLAFLVWRMDIFPSMRKNTVNRKARR
ncbi:MAG: hypothetical protein R3277_00360 [Brumimicrobium sp.]|nr:hypothetical protein [Brumimicrobium sp.]